jgi:hypothetical protein
MPRWDVQFVKDVPVRVQDIVPSIHVKRADGTQLVLSYWLNLILRILGNTCPICLRTSGLPNQKFVHCISHNSPRPLTGDGRIK